MCAGVRLGILFGLFSVLLSACNDASAPAAFADTLSGCGSGTRVAISFGTGAKAPAIAVARDACANQMQIDTTGFHVPVVSNGLLDFGNVGISSLYENQLNVCGSNGKERCGIAILRAYTIGTGPGFYDAQDDFSAPIFASLTSSLGSRSQIGFTAAGATPLETLTIPATQRYITLADFNPTPVFDVQVDFTDAGAGTYSATVVSELALDVSP